MSHIFFAIILLFVFSLNIIAQNSETAISPNIIIIMTDDQGYGDFDITGNDIIETPTINRFASQAARLG